jgi:hypothetical protein
MIQKIGKEGTSFTPKIQMPSIKRRYMGWTSVILTGVTCKSSELNITVNFILNPHYTQIKRSKNID